MLIASTMLYPEVVEHPDSGKVLALSGRVDEAAAVMLAFRRDDAGAGHVGEEGPGGEPPAAVGRARRVRPRRRAPWTRAKA